MTGGLGSPPAGVVLDLDDTLYPQLAYLDGAAAAVGAAAAAAGLAGDAVLAALRAELAAGSDRGGTIDRALAACGVPDTVATAVLPGLVAAFVGYRPRRLPAYPGVRDALAALRGRYPLACLTDGNPAVQRAKLAATGLAGAFDAVVITDELGGRCTRKPNPAGPRRIAAMLGVPVTDLVVVGDRPARDVAVAVAVGARSIRVRTGEYAAAADDPMATVLVPDLVTAAVLLLAAGQHAAGQHAAGPDATRRGAPAGAPRRGDAAPLSSA
ncbi:MAG: HAD family hydrolase [Actinobacteria bacterium]|nr:HAD family hydrolase [Actinomycetota bacterium]